MVKSKFIEPRYEFTKQELSVIKRGFRAFEKAQGIIEAKLREREEQDEQTKIPHW